MDSSKIVKNPIILDPGNFTQLTKTPWAGSTIWEQYKSHHKLPAVQLQIGESWEFSCDPIMPSRLRDYPEWTVIDLITIAPEAVLSDANKDQHAHILLKLLNADQPLSFQVHPRDNDPHLQAHECGKPESWLILDAEPNSGIYLGFKNGVTKEDLGRMLKAGESLENSFEFVPVKANDYFDIAPGVAHAIGSGVTLLEPQRISRGKSGKTYRLWDWGRRYSQAGKIDPLQGEARKLHIAESLAIVDPSKQCGAEFLATLKKTPSSTTVNPGVKMMSFPSNQDYCTERVSFAAGSAAKLRLENGYAIVFIARGSLTMTGRGGALTLAEKGQTVLLPHAAAAIEFHSAPNSDLVMIYPATSSRRWH